MDMDGEQVEERMPGKRKDLRATPGGGSRTAPRGRPKAGETPDLFADLERTGRAAEGRGTPPDPAVARPAKGGGEAEGVPRARGKPPDEGRTGPAVVGNPFDPWGALFSNFSEPPEEGVSPPVRPRPAGTRKKKPAARR